MPAPIRVMSVFGTRPEAIKMAPVLLALEKDPHFTPIHVATGQHREMLDQVLDLFGIKPHVDLNIMEPNQTLYGITRKALEGLEMEILAQKPDLILVQGDTTTAFVAGLAGFYAKVPVGHVEAGLRTHNVYDPFPEEMNRRLLSQLTDLHFAPTESSCENLLKEGFPKEKIGITGNTVTDALLSIAAGLPEGLPADLPQISPDKRMILVETHRRENLGTPMQEICTALRTIVNDFTNCEIIFSVHKNPKVREVVFPALQGVERVHLIEPVDYTTLIRLMRASTLILTDSGGIQEEAPSLGKPVLVLRKTTERPEGVHAGVAKLVGTDQSVIVSEASRLLSDSQAYQAMSQVASPYGDGRAAERILAAIRHRFGIDADRPRDFAPASGRG
ncbi:UDP-N-acetylglucosamine 2-epimerase [bacterium SCN 62-11]|nr:UDP-N-acetylglucosamine 2-epimerase (non-hydrolyzing) [Candidatus Eremiobacteraeota bacterium]ODT61909.1 MAG: UDP-N-acetylglucosamine 2-epimerase [bacterium SCN 62-11]